VTELQIEVAPDGETIARQAAQFVAAQANATVSA
jgi:hypothetical protein